MQRPTVSSRRLTAAAAIICAAALIPAGALADGGASSSAAPDAPLGPGGAPAPAAASASCATSGLVVWLDTQGTGTAGSVIYTLDFTNLSGHTCTLSGYPGISAVDLAGHQLGSAASRDTTATAHTVTLIKGANATAVLRIVDAGNYPSSSCHQVTAAGLRVFPPNLTSSKVIPFPFSACSLSGPVSLSVRAVKHA